MEPPELPPEPGQAQYLGPLEKEEDVRWALVISCILVVGAILLGLLQKVLGLF